MRRKGSRIAQMIDQEYKIRNWWQNELKYRKEYCRFCRNQKTNLCEIRRTISGECRCVYFEKEEK